MAVKEAQIAKFQTDHAKLQQECATQKDQLSTYGLARALSSDRAYADCCAAWCMQASKAAVRLPGGAGAAAADSGRLKGCVCARTAAGQRRLLRARPRVHAVSDLACACSLVLLPCSCLPPNCRAVAAARAIPPGSAGSAHKPQSWMGKQRSKTGT